MIEKPHPIPLVAKINDKINTWVAGMHQLPTIPRNIHDVRQIQAYANQQLQNGAKLVDIGNQGDSGIVENGTQVATFGFGNCFLTFATSPDGKAFLAHEDSPYLNTATPFDSFGRIQPIWLNKELILNRLTDGYTHANESIFGRYDYIDLNKNDDSRVLETINTALTNFTNDNNLILNDFEKDWLVKICFNYIKREGLNSFFMEYLYTALIRELEHLKYDEENEYLNKLQNSVFLRYIADKINQNTYSDLNQANLSQKLEQFSPGSTLFLGESFSYTAIWQDRIFNEFSGKLSDTEFEIRLNEVFKSINKSPNMLFTNMFQEQIDLDIKSIFQDVLSKDNKEVEGIRDYIIKKSFYQGDENIVRTDEYIRTIYEKTKIAVESGKVSKVLIYPPKKPWNIDYPKKADGSVDYDRMHTDVRLQTEEFKGRAWRLAQGPDGIYRPFVEKCFLRGGGEYSPNLGGGTNAPIYLEPKEIDLTKPITVESITQQLLEFGYIKNPFIPSNRNTGPNIYSV